MRRYFFNLKKVFMIGLLGFFVSSFAYSGAEYGIKLEYGTQTVVRRNWLLVELDRRGKLPSEQWSSFNFDNWRLRLDGILGVGVYDLYRSVSSVFDFSPGVNFCALKVMKATLNGGPSVGVGYAYYREQNMGIDWHSKLLLAGINFQSGVCLELGRFIIEGAFHYRYLWRGAHTMLIFSEEFDREGRWQQDNFHTISLIFSTGLRIKKKVFELGLQMERTKFKNIPSWSPWDHILFVGVRF
jgi:hypothetical protein